MFVGSIVGAVHFHVFVVGDGLDEAEDVLAAVGVEAIEENGVGSAVFAGEFGIADDNFAFVGDAKLHPHLQNNFHFLACGHGASSSGVLLDFGCSERPERRIGVFAD